ncbi:hypothetical protein ANO14919_103920 [Xylariales sp. No.14919]|nr:hypothetical protein ANO14919_103920 [Xylariales sp. No.14919]
MTGEKGTIVVTGVSGGLGSAIVSNIVSSPEMSRYHGVYTTRSGSAAPALKSALQPPSGSRHHAYTIMTLDLSRMESVRKAATDINSAVLSGQIPPIRTLILNAGWMEYGTQTWTEDGFDMTFASNYLGHWLLTLLLLKSMDRDAGRVVVVGSSSHDPDLNKKRNPHEKWKIILRNGTGAVAKGTWSTAEEDPSWRSGFRRYGASKLCELLMMSELQRRLNSDPVLRNVSVVSVDPGTMPTSITRRSPSPVLVFVFQYVLPFLAAIWVLLWPNGALRTTGKSAADVLAAAFDPETTKGVYLDGRKRAQTSAEARDTQKQKMLWEDTVRYAQLEEGETILARWK